MNDQKKNTTPGALFKNYATLVLRSANLPVCTASINLLTVIAAYESDGFCTVKSDDSQMQTVGFFHLQPANYYKILMFAHQRKLFSLPKNFNRLIFDTRLSIIAARIFFLMVKEPLPAEKNINWLCLYASTYWKSEKKISKECFLKAYKRYCL